MSGPRSATGTSSRTWRRAGVLGGLALVVAVLVAGPPASELPFEPRGTGPLGLGALLEVIEETGGQVDVSTDLHADLGSLTEGLQAGAAPPVIFLPVDQLGEDERARVRTALEAGARLVVADPSSPLHDALPVGVPADAAVGRTTRSPDCPELPDVDGVRHADWLMLSDEQGIATGRAWSCFPEQSVVGGTSLGTEAGGADPEAARSAWLWGRDVGAGTQVVLGSAEPLTNGALGLEDNVVLALALLSPAPGGELLVVPRGAADADPTSLLALLPRSLRDGLVLGGLAALVWVLWRARRVGAPVSERLPPVVPSAELARSVGGLLHRAADRDGAASALRTTLCRELAGGLHRPVSSSPEQLLEETVARLDVDPDAAARAILPRPVADDGQLMSIAHAIDDVRTALDMRRQGGVPAAPVTGVLPGGPPVAEDDRARLAARPAAGARTPDLRAPMGGADTDGDGIDR